ncbi:MAG: hypothetical protein ACLRQ0_01800 [Monoglobales bacterium]
MKNFIKPEIEILLFDEEEIMADTSTVKANYAARQLNEYMFDEKNVNSTTTVKIQDIQVQGE